MSSPSAPMIWHSLIRLALGLSISVLLLSGLVYLIAKSGSEVNLTVVAQGLTSISAAVLSAYVVIVIANTLLRTERYRLLLRVSEPSGGPDFSALFLVTAVRNMVVDLLPSRSGELFFIAMLRSFCRVSIPAGTATLALSLLLDVSVLIPILAAVVLWPVTSEVFQEGALAAALTFVTLVVGAGIVLWPGLRRFSRLLRRLFNRPGLLGRLSTFVSDISEALQRCRRGQVLGKAFLLTCAIRTLKYGGLLLLFREVSLQIDTLGTTARTPDILAALVASEVGASLPVPTLMSFGTYEAGGASALVLLGYPFGFALLILLTIHIASQIVDYAVGVACLLFLVVFKGKGKSALRKPPQRLRARGALAGLVLILASAVFVSQFDRLTALRSNAPPPSGRSVAQVNDLGALPNLPASADAWVAWSSNRFGSHDILRMNLVDGGIVRLTQHPHTETFPRISPDGQKLIFARSRRPWVSLRDLVEWDTFMLDLQTGEERLIAEYASAAHWSSDGTRIYFQRRGTQVVELNLASQQERIFFRVGSGAVPDTVVFYEPSASDISGRLAATWRGSERKTTIVNPDGSVTPVGGGCHLSWGPEEQYVYWVDHGGLIENQLLRRDLRTGATEVWLDLPPPFSHEYFPKVSADGRLLVLGASAGGHEHDVADYEIFIWPVGRPSDEAIRLTFHSGNDNWPDVFSRGTN